MPAIDILHIRADNDLLIQSVYAHREVDKGRVANRQAGGWHSSTQDILERPGFPELKARVDGLAVDRRLLYCWAIVNPKGVGNALHAHHPDALTFCYYPRDSAAPLMFPRESVDLRIHPRAGMLVRFSGRLLHEVMSNPLEEDRVVITFDYMP